MNRFTFRQRQDDTCPHGCRSWAREIGPNGFLPDVKDGQGKLHHPNCPQVLPCVCAPSHFCNGCGGEHCYC